MKGERGPQQPGLDKRAHSEGKCCNVIFFFGLVPGRFGVRGRGRREQELTDKTIGAKIDSLEAVGRWGEDGE